MVWHLDELKKQFPENKGYRINAQVEGTFADGSKTVFDFAVTDNAGNIVQVAESKTNTSRFTDQQKRYYNAGEDVKVKIGKKTSTINTKNTQSITYRWKVNRFTGSSEYKSAKNFMTKMVSKLK